MQCWLSLRVLCVLPLLYPATTHSGRLGASFTPLRACLGSFGLVYYFAPLRLTPSFGHYFCRFGNSYDLLHGTQNPCSLLSVFTGGKPPAPPSLVRFGFRAALVDDVGPCDFLGAITAHRARCYRTTPNDGLFLCCVYLQSFRPSISLCFTDLISWSRPIGRSIL